jgi:hypothetical protein
MFKMVEDSKNNVRIFRKPMPPEVKAEFARKSKEYHSFKAIERNEIEKELNAQLKVQLKALDACTHLPDYLMDEVFGEDGSMREEDMNEFKPSIVYMEQMLRLFPREITAKWKLYPAFEESFMRMEESRNQSDAGGN